MSITLFIVVITGAISWYAWRSPEVLRKLVLSPVAISRNKEYFRFISSGFIHQDFMHLGFNLYVLYMFGGFLEQLFSIYFPGISNLLFVVMYVLAIVVSDIPSYYKNRNNEYYASLGASGAVSAVIFAVILFEPLLPLRFMFFPFFDIPGVVLGIGYLAYEYYQGKKSTDNINHDAHFYGALFGMIFVLVMRPATLTEFFVKILDGINGLL